MMGMGVESGRRDIAVTGDGGLWRLRLGSL